MHIFVNTSWILAKSVDLHILNSIYFRSTWGTSIMIQASSINVPFAALCTRRKNIYLCMSGMYMTNCATTYAMIVVKVLLVAANWIITLPFIMPLVQRYVNFVLKMGKMAESYTVHSPWKSISLVTRTTARILLGHKLSKSRLKDFIFNHQFKCLKETLEPTLFNQNCHTDMEFMFFNIWFGLSIQNKTKRGKNGKIVAVLCVTPSMGSIESAAHTSATILDCSKIVAVVCVTAIK